MSILALAVLLLLGCLGLAGGVVVAYLMRRPAAPAPAPAVLDPSKIPPKWGWARLRSVPFDAFALGYYYVDPVAGPSFKAVVDLKEPASDAQIAARAAAARYLGESTYRLGAHEWANAGAVPEDFARLMRQKLEDGGPSGTAVVTLTEAERAAYGLPAVPAWISVYSG